MVLMLVALQTSPLPAVHATCLAFYVLYFELPALEEVQQCIVLQLVRARWRHPRLSQPVELPGRAGG